MKTLFKKAKPQSNAAVMGLTYGLDTSQGYWLRADPVELRADINSAYFLGQAALTLDLAQAQKLAERIKPLLVPLELELCVPDPYAWFLKSKHPILLNTPPPETIVGASIHDYLTEAEPWLRRLFTEIQMLLVNENAVTGLWLWGGGVLADAKLKQQHWWQKLI